MTRSLTMWIVFVGTAVLAAVAGWVAISTNQSNPGFADAAATLAFITGAAVAIERVIEMLWTTLGGLLGTYWPLKPISEQVNKLVDDLDEALGPFHAQATFTLEHVQANVEHKDAVLAELISEMRRKGARFNDLKNLATRTPDGQRIQLMAASASQTVDLLTQKYGDAVPRLKAARYTADAAINGLQDFLATFKDNPGRRLISLYVGAILGLIVAGLFSLDLFQAVLVTPNTEPVSLLDLRVILTGLIIGLGSTPTHEIIRAVQEFKESQKRQNVANPNLPSPDTARARR
jgi:hypothetical protein